MFKFLIHSATRATVRSAMASAERTNAVREAELNQSHVTGEVGSIPLSAQASDNGQILSASGGGDGYELSGSAGDMPTSRSGLAQISLFLGVLSLVSSCCCGAVLGVFALFIGPPLGIGALITGWMGLNALEEDDQDGRTMAIAGMVLGGLTLAIGLALVALTLVGVGATLLPELMN